MKPDHERRKFERKKVALKVDYCVIEKPHGGESHSNNLCLGGICMPIKARLTPGTLLELKIYLLSEFRKPIIAKGEVVWVNHQHDKKYPFITGVKFTAINPLDAKQIQSYFDTLDAIEADITWFDNE